MLQARDRVDVGQIERAEGVLHRANADDTRVDGLHARKFVLDHDLTAVRRRAGRIHPRQRRTRPAGKPYVSGNFVLGEGTKNQFLSRTVSVSDGYRRRNVVRGNGDRRVWSATRQPRSFVVWTAFWAGAAVSSAAPLARPRAACWSQAT